MLVSNFTKSQSWPDIRAGPWHTFCKGPQLREIKPPRIERIERIEESFLLHESRGKLCYRRDHRIQGPSIRAFLQGDSEALHPEAVIIHSSGMIHKNDGFPSISVTESFRRNRHVRVRQDRCQAWLSRLISLFISLFSTSLSQVWPRKK